MAISLTVLRDQDEGLRFDRQRRDDSRTAITVDSARALEADLRNSTRAEVRFDAGSRALYSTDGSNYRQVPIGVVIPRSIDDVIATVAAARRHEAPVLSRGGGTSLAGQCCNVAVVMDFSKYLHLLIHIDPEKKLGTVQPGCVLDTLRHTAERRFNLTFAPDPSTHNHCTLGGMLGNDSCGAHSLLGAKFGRGLRVADRKRKRSGAFDLHPRHRHLHGAADEKVTRLLHARQNGFKRPQFLVVFDLNVWQCSLRGGSE